MQRLLHPSLVSTIPRRIVRHASTTPLPDFNTPVDVAQHSLPTSKAQLARKRRRQQLKQFSENVEGSLVGETLQQMENDKEFQRTASLLKELGQKALTREEKKQRRRALDELEVPPFDVFLKRNQVDLLKRVPTDLFQVNIGLYCNQACNHCHVESSPKRKQEQMTREVADRCLDIIRSSPTVKTLDITGGAPELCDEFRYLVVEARKMGLEVIDRCNLTVLSEPGQEDLVQFLADNQVHVVASLPCYSMENVDQQRGNGVFERSISGLLRLNEAGYGVEGSNLHLDLVYNPLGAFLPPPQDALEAKYKEELESTFGIVFNNLFCITNMPIKRFADFLFRRGELKDYMELLVRNFNPSACENVMCTSYINVRYDGRLFDCDFNQQLDMPLKTTKSSDGKQSTKDMTVFDIQSTEDYMQHKILTSNHCFGCVSGMGSSCQGTTA